MPDSPPSASPQAPSRSAEQAVPSLRAARYSQSLERGLAILSAFSAERPVMGIAEIAEALGMSRSTTHRYASTLLALGYLEQGASRKYRLGLRVTELGMSALSATPLREHARPFLVELRAQYPYASNVAVLDGDEVVLVDRVRGLRRGRHSLESTLHPGSRFPAHCTAIGKLLLAYLPQPAQQQLVSSLRLARHGPRTITSRRELREELTRIRAAGIATSQDELAADLQAIAMPVHDEAGEVIAGVNLVAGGSKVCLAQLLEEVGAPLRSTAGRISARLGYCPA